MIERTSMCGLLCLTLVLGCRGPVEPNTPADSVDKATRHSTKASSGVSSLKERLQGQWDVQKAGKKILSFQIEQDQVSLTDTRFGKERVQKGTLKIMLPDRFGIQNDKGVTSYFRFISHEDRVWIGLGSVWPMGAPNAFQVPIHTQEAVVYDGQSCRLSAAGEAVKCAVEGDGPYRVFRYEGQDPLKKGEKRDFVYHMVGQRLVSDSLFKSVATRVVEPKR